ncbi:MAG: 16S rRNA (cytidine(1402)-2'-O)-methyltransferase [Alphaproteobacteria bacterium]|nr:16S rRNA (cytidine(1402)-2'-O)-methyltransferase [Alphaproteobacteria bacterium]
MLNNALFIVATPIGNLQDITLRALDTLKNAQVIACEDTRVTKKLFSLLGLKPDKIFISYQDHNEQEKAQEIIDIINQGKSVALVSDAGSPLISDPGYKLVRKCNEQNIKVVTVPGASAVISALQISGLATNRFMFAGFIPNKEKARLDLFLEFKNINTTLVFYETANRLGKTLATMEQVFNSREIAVAREITKLYEECIRGNAKSLIKHYTQNPPKGEIVIMVAPPDTNSALEIDLEKELLLRLNQMSLKSAVKEVSGLANINKNQVYDLALRLKNEKL